MRVCQDSWRHFIPDRENRRATNTAKASCRTTILARLVSVVAGLVCGLASSTQAQTTTNFIVSITPPAGALMPSGSTNPVFVAITNFTLFTNITVVGTFGASGNIPFLDNGQPPDLTANDGVFSGYVVAPLTAAPTNVTLNLVITGGLPPSDPTQTNLTIASTNLTLTYRVVPRPGNDDFANAYKILAAGGVVFGSNNFATIQPGEPFHAQDVQVAASVWWNWSPAVNTNVLIDTAGSSFNPVLAVYTGPDLQDLVPVAASTNDPLHRLKAHVNFDAIRGATYRIAVAGYDTNGVGAIRLRVALGALPDYVGPSVSITNPSGGMVSTTNRVTLAGTAKDDDPAASATPVVQVFLQLNNNPPVPAVGTTNWSGTVTLLPGTNVVYAFGQDLAGNLGATDQVMIAFVNPTNDDFADAIQLLGTAGVVSAINGRATLEPGEPLHCDNQGGHSIWYSWIAPAGGTLSLTTTNSSFDTLLDLYVGTALTNLVDLTCADGFDTISQPVVSNQLYYISVDGYGGQTGNIQLSYSFAGIASTQQFVNLIVDQPLGGTVSPGSRTLPTYSSVTLNAVAETNYQFVAWAGGVTNPANPLTVTLDRDLEVSAFFQVKKYIDSFETGDFSVLPWTTTGDAPWVIETNVVDLGQFAAQSGPIGDSQSSSLILTLTTQGGTGSFDLRVSSEVGFDWLEFWLDGIRLQRWSGEVGWQNYRFAVPAGLNRFEWRYAKDANYAAGLDAAFIDNLYLPLATAGSTNLTPQISLTYPSAGSPLLDVAGPVNQLYYVQSSGDLQAWTPLTTNVAGLNGFQFLDTQATNYPTRFYRVLAP